MLYLVLSRYWYRTFIQTYSATSPLKSTLGNGQNFFAKLLSKSNNLCGSGSGGTSALPLPQKEDLFQLPLPHPWLWPCNAKIMVTEKRWNAKNSSNMIAYSFFMRENNAWLLIPKLPFLCFSEVAAASNLAFSALAIVRHYTGTLASLLSFLHFFKSCWKDSPCSSIMLPSFQKKVNMTMKKMNLHIILHPNCS